MFRNFLLYILIVCFILFGWQLGGTQPNKTNYKILGISVQGNVTSDPSVIIASSGLKVNDEIEIPGDATINAIKRIYALNIFSDVIIEKERQVGNGIYILIKVKEFPRLETFIFKGNDEISEKDLEKKINLVKGQILKPQDISKVKRLLFTTYESEGFLNAKINPRILNFKSADTSGNTVYVRWVNPADLSDETTTEINLDDKLQAESLRRIKNRVLLRIEIDEGKEVVVRKINFFGNQAFDAGDLKSEFEETSEKVWWKFWKSANFDRKKFEKDKELLIDFYKKNGYRDAVILGDTLVIDETRENMAINIYLYEGPQYKIRNIKWIGNTIYSDEQLNKRLDFKTGDIYDLKKFERNLRANETQSDVSSLYFDNGYLGFTLKQEEQKVADDSVDIIIRISEKNQFKIGNVEIKGNDKTKDKVIRRELFTRPGDYFNRALLLRSLQQLANLQFFNVEKLYQEGVDYFPTSDSTVDITYKVEEKSSDYLNASVGYSGSFGFSGAVGITLTNFAIDYPFQLGGGQVLSFNWQFGVGNFYRTFSLGFTEPWFLDTPTLLGFDVFDTRQIYIYDLRQNGGSARVGRRLKWPDNYFSVLGLFRFQMNDVKSGGGYYNTGLTRQFTLGGNISRKDIDNPIFPSIGSTISIDAEISGGPLLPGDVDYAKIDFNMEWYRRLFGTNRLTLYLGSSVGMIKELVQGTPIQPFEYYYMGGNGLIIATQPLRGYDDRTVGPRNADGNVIGGKFSIRNTLELRLAVTLEPMPLYLLAFAEAGNVWRDSKDINMFDLKRSVGIGARILINPIGLIGFDLGYGFDRKSVDGKDPAWIFHFQFGKGF
ncbi:MAG: outer membrane protein assembly factor BamA [Ignavibacteria bacterium]|nr:outer membrane protein assembly factor BamA [Ignavibacteria bacterium]